MRRFSFTKADRILKRQDFIRLARRGRKTQNQHFIAKFYQNDLQRSRLGITVTRKVGIAVTRNRIKRLTREYFRHHRHDLEGSWDINIIAKNKAAGLNSALMFRTLQDLISRIETH